MDVVKLELNAICRVCLQSGEMEAIFGAGGEDTAISLKIGQCSSIELIHGTNMPEHICTECVDDLEMAYRFRTNCESSDAILKSFVETAVLNDIINGGSGCSRATEEAINNHPMIMSSASAADDQHRHQATAEDAGDEQPPVGDLQLDEICADNVGSVLLQQQLQQQPTQKAMSMSSNRLISDDAIIEGVEFDAVDRGMLKVKVQGEDQYVEYRVNVSDVDLLSETATFQLVQDDDDEIAVVIQSSVNDAIAFDESEAPADVRAESTAMINVDAEGRLLLEDIQREAAMHGFSENSLDVVLQEQEEAAGNDDDGDVGQAVSPPYGFKLESDEPDYGIIDESNEAVDIDQSIDANNDDDEFLDPNTEILQIKAVKSNKSRQTYRGAGSQQPAAAKRQSGEAKPPKVCEICGNQYKFQHALDGHMRRHRNEKPFECHICGKGFVINFELSRHMRTHTGHKPYACSYCERRFSDFGSRAKHERTHTGERPYPCEKCGKSFAYSHVLTSHMLTHTGVKRFGCDTCGKRFAKSHHLKAHMNTHMKTLHHASSAMVLMMAAAETSTTTTTASSSAAARPGGSSCSTSGLIAAGIEEDEAHWSDGGGGVIEGLAAAYGGDGGLLMSDITGRIIADCGDDETGENFMLELGEMDDEDETAAVHLIHYSANNELPHC